MNAKIKNARKITRTKRKEKLLSLKHIAELNTARATKDHRRRTQNVNQKSEQRSIGEC